MLATTKSITINGVSSAEINGVNKIIAYFNGQIQSDGKHTISKAIQDEKLYNTYKNTVKEDYDEFETLIESHIMTE